jgi:DDE superfamily endonuclease
MSLHGPYAGSRHDSGMLRESNLIPDLRRMLPNAGFEINGDPAYPQSALLYGAFRNPAPGSPEAQFNTHMLQVRQCVEWGFKEVVAQFQFFHHKNGMKIYKQPIGKYYIVAIYLQNL